MSEIQNNDDAPRNDAENPVAAPAPEDSAVPAVPAEEKHEQRLVESELEASHSGVLPLSPIESGAPEAPAAAGAGTTHGRRGLRRGNAGRGKRDGKNASQSVGVVENPKDVQETLSGKFVDGYEKDRDFRRAREQRRRGAEKSAAEVLSAAGEPVPAAQGWCLTDSSDPHCRRHPQSNTNANHTKLIIEPAPIPEQEKDPSFWQKFKAKVLAIFGLDKKKKRQRDKNRRGGKYRNKHGKKFYGKNGGDGDFRKGDRNGEFRGGNRRRRHNRGPRPGNSGARPQQNGGSGAPTSAA